MEDNRRLILGTTVSGADAVGSESNNPQAINTSTPADVENTVTLDVSLPTDGTVADYHDSRDMGDDRLIIPAAVLFIDNQIISVSLDTRLASNFLTAADVAGRLDHQFAMTSNTRQTDDYLTIVDMYGRGQPRAHHLLKEGGSGYVTFENGNRILIL